MAPIVTPQQAVDLTLQTTMMVAEAQMVIAMRLWGMAGLWQTSPGENERMVQEKTDAMMASGRAASRAMMAGKGAAEVALAALKPVRARTKSNAARLSKRGPGKPA